MPRSGSHLGSVRALRGVQLLPQACREFLAAVVVDALTLMYSVTLPMNQGKDVVDGCRDELFGHMPDHEERLSTVCAMTDEEKRSLGRSKIKCILQRTRSSPLMRLLAPRDEFFEGKRDRMEKVISCQESALGIQS